MPPTDDATSYPLLKVYNDIGKITKGIEGLEKGQGELVDGQREVEQKITGLHKSVAALVTREECEANCSELEERVEEVAACAGAAKELAKDKPGLLARAANNAGDITKIMTLVVSLLVGLYMMHKFMIRLESAMDRTTAKATEATKKLKQRLDKPQTPQVVYVPVVVKPDAGVRRRRPRRVRRPWTKRATTP